MTIIQYLFNEFDEIYYVNQVCHDFAFYIKDCQQWWRKYSDYNYKNYSNSYFRVERAFFRNGIFQTIRETAWFTKILTHMCNNKYCRGHPILFFCFDSIFNILYNIYNILFVHKKDYTFWIYLNYTIILFCFYILLLVVMFALIVMYLVIIILEYNLNFFLLFCHFIYIASDVVLKIIDGLNFRYCLDILIVMRSFYKNEWSSYFDEYLFNQLNILNRYLATLNLELDTSLEIIFQHWPLFKCCSLIIIFVCAKYSYVFLIGRAFIFFMFWPFLLFFDVYLLYCSKVMFLSTYMPSHLDYMYNLIYTNFIFVLYDVLIKIPNIPFLYYHYLFQYFYEVLVKSCFRAYINMIYILRMQTGHYYELPILFLLRFSSMTREIIGFIQQFQLTRSTVNFITYFINIYLSISFVIQSIVSVFNFCIYIFYEFFIIKILLNFSICVIIYIKYVYFILEYIIVYLILTFIQVLFAITFIILKCLNISKLLFELNYYYLNFDNLIKIILMCSNLYKILFDYFFDTFCVSCNSIFVSLCKDDGFLFINLKNLFYYIFLLDEVALDGETHKSFFIVNGFFIENRWYLVYHYYVILWHYFKYQALIEVTFFGFDSFMNLYKHMLQVGANRQFVEFSAIILFFVTIRLIISYFKKDRNPLISMLLIEVTILSYMGCISLGLFVYLANYIAGDINVGGWHMIIYYNGAFSFFFSLSLFFLAADAIIGLFIIILLYKRYINSEYKTLYKNAVLELEYLESDLANLDIMLKGKKLKEAQKVQIEKRISIKLKDYTKCINAVVECQKNIFGTKIRYLKSYTIKDVQGDKLRKLLLKRKSDFCANKFKRD
jgi:hypothetical protein